MKIVHKIVFFISVVILAFIPGGIFISFVLLLLYYGPSMLKSFLAEVNEDEKNSQENTFRCTIIEPDYSRYPLTKMDAYSDDTLEEMK